MPGVFGKIRTARRAGYPSPDPGRGVAGPILLPPEFRRFGKRRNALVNRIPPGAGFPDPGGRVPGRN